MTTWAATLWFDDLEGVDHNELGFARLVKAYRGDQPRVQAFLDALMDDVQSLEDVAVDVLVARWPLTAEGAQLDTIGEIVRQGRNNMTDDQYRLWILVRILVNRSNGKINELVEILDKLGVLEIFTKEYWPAGLYLEGLTPYGPEIAELLAQAKAGGVQVHWVHGANEDTLQMSDTLGASDSDADTGFATLGGPPYTAGGYTAGEDVI